MSALQLLTPQTTDQALRIAIPDAQWLVELSVHDVTDQLQLKTNDEEAAVVLLSGTFDLVGGSSSWPSRGARSTPTGGRPVAVYLPPDAPFSAAASSADGGHSLLVARSRRPKAEPTKGREALSSIPLLPMAGSDKSFDPQTGEWRPAETFASAPEHLTPRRIERIEKEGAVIERVFAADYKAAAISVDEIALQPGASLSLSALPQPASAVECAIFVQSPHPVRIEHDGQTLDVSRPDGSRGFAFCAGAPTGLQLHCEASGANETTAAYIAIAYAGK